jgi:hypothetical protein
VRVCVSVCVAAEGKAVLGRCRFAFWLKVVDGGLELLQRCLCVASACWVGGEGFQLAVTYSQPTTQAGVAEASWCVVD